MFINYQYLEISPAGAVQFRGYPAESISVSASPTSTDIAAPDDAAAVVHRFVRRLRERHAACAAHLPPSDDPVGGVSCALLLADAVLRDCRGGDAWRLRPTQIAVLGPTQTGKSTVVNLLLGVTAAAVSPLAGFTVHPQGFARCCDVQAEWASTLFPARRRRASANLTPDDFAAYSLESAPGNDGDGASDALVIWDTPDFDSLASAAYLDGVLETAALADVLVLVLSKEKYSDLSVWRLLRLIEPLARSLVVCVNKLSPDGAETIRRSVRDRLRDLGGRYSSAPFVSLPYVARLDELDAEPHAARVAELRGKVFEQCSVADRSRRTNGACRVLREHWDAWVAPIEAEQAALRAWSNLCGHAITAALETYERDFLNHPQRFDTFRRAVVELTQLLEPPRTAAVLGSLRWVVSWPARQLFAAREAWRVRRTAPSDRPHRLGSEQTVLYDEIDTVLTRVARDAARRADAHEPGAAVWRALAQRLTNEHESVRARFRQAAERHHQEFAAEIRNAADSLYNKLQEHPTLLNTLRATRITVDVAGIAIALKTAGVGSAGLLLTPAVFAVTSMLAEGALGTYMKSVADDLRRRQRTAAERDVFRGAWEPALRALGDELRDEQLFGIDAADMRAAAVALERWEASLQ